MELVGAAGRGEAESGNGSRGAVVCGFGGSSRVQAATMCYEVSKCCHWWWRRILIQRERGRQS